VRVRANLGEPFHPDEARYKIGFSSGESLGSICGKGLRQVESKGIRIDLSTLRSWTFITSHAQVLLAVARNPEATVTELARAAEITERSAYRILADLQRSGYVRRQRAGRHNRYEVNPALPLRDPTVEKELVRDLLRLGGDDDEVEAHALPGLRRA
jgi:DNA-binding transcriptional ArsR family regulator